MEFQAYNLDGYMELDGKEFIEDNQDTLTELGGRQAYIFPEANLNDLAEAVGLERGEEIVSEDEIIDKQLLRYIGLTANKRDLIDIMRNTGKYFPYTMGIGAVREAFFQAVEEGTVTKGNVYGVISEMGNVSSYLATIRDMIEKEVVFPIMDSRGNFLWSSSARESPATMRITDVSSRNGLTFVTNTHVYSADGSTYREYPGIYYSGGIATDRAGRAKKVNVRTRNTTHPMFNLAWLDVTDAVRSHMIAMAVENMPDTSTVLKDLIAFYV